jgi:hypothetical protein
MCVKNQQMQQSFIQFINYVWYLLHVSALHCQPQAAFLVCLVTWCKHHASRYNTPVHNILLTAPRLSISQNALGTLPGDVNVMPKHVRDTIHN